MLAFPVAALTSVRSALPRRQCRDQFARCHHLDTFGIRRAWDERDHDRGERRNGERDEQLHRDRDGLAALLVQRRELSRTTSSMMLRTHAQTAGVSLTAQLSML